VARRRYPGRFWAAYDGSRATRELGLSYTPVAETFRRIIGWAVAEGLVTRSLGRGFDAPI
jgi:hypothetical protein